ncbi:hypothetical protein LCGC14_1794590 [marine sediment metagenome]|uniref:Uncharacterized protein n=1 Tax=marine sediment metagenome TaxID=412755 RepID=A0A0F9JR26_9ZZZZ
MSSDQVAENRRAEYQSLREEVYRSDRTCVILMGFLIAATGAAGKLFFDNQMPLPLALLSPVWFLAFWYFTEKRFVIKLIANYLRTEIEEQENGLGWQQFLSKVPPRVRRPALPFGPYYLEVVACGTIVIGVPVYGLVRQVWDAYSAYAVVTVIIAGLFIFLAVRSLYCYKTIGARYNETLTAQNAEQGAVADGSNSE